MDPRSACRCLERPADYSVIVLMPVSLHDGRSAWPSPCSLPMIKRAGPMQRKTLRLMNRITAAYGPFQKLRDASCRRARASRLPAQGYFGWTFRKGVLPEIIRTMQNILSDAHRTSAFSEILHNNALEKWAKVVKAQGPK